MKLKESCEAYQIPWEDSHKHKGLAMLLAKKFKDKADAQDTRLLEEDIPNDDTEMNKVAQVCFLQHMLPRWFMHPFTSQSGGAIK